MALNGPAAESIKAGRRSVWRVARRVPTQHRQKALLDADHMADTATHLFVLTRRRFGPGVEEDGIGPFDVSHQFTYMFEHDRTSALEYSSSSDGVSIIDGC